MATGKFNRLIRLMFNRYLALLYHLQLNAPAVNVLAYDARFWSSRKYFSRWCHPGVVSAPSTYTYPPSSMANQHLLCTLRYEYEHPHLILLVCTYLPSGMNTSTHLLLYIFNLKDGRFPSLCTYTYSPSDMNIHHLLVLGNVHTYPQVRTPRTSLL